MLSIREVQALGGYKIVNADPAWSYNDLGCNGAVPYEVMSPPEIRGMPVREIVADDAALFLWGTYPKLPEVLEVGNAWGFKFKSIAFQWIKYRGVMKVTPAELRRQAAELLRIADEIERGILSGKEDWLRIVPFLGLGRWTRGNTEPCLLFTRGKPRRVDKAVSQLIETFDGEDVLDDGILQAPLGRHSAKPRQVRDRIKKLMGDLPAVELFARERVEGWDAWGNDPALGTPDISLTGKEIIHDPAIGIRLIHEREGERRAQSERVARDAAAPRARVRMFPAFAPAGRSDSF